MRLANQAFHTSQDSQNVVMIAADASFRLGRPGHRAPSEPLVDQPHEAPVTSWQAFHHAIGRQPLLAQLDHYPDALLIDGCDWSATTAVTRLFKRLPYFADSSSGHNDELDGALLLSGLRGKEAGGRHCFQTSYVRENFREYFLHEHFRLVWIVREPRAAVSSLLGNRGKALPRSAAEGLTGKSRGQGASRLEKACATYLASIRQTLELEERLGERIAIVDYDELAAARAELLPALCRFASVPFDTHLLRHLHGKSVRKGVLASWEARIVDELTLPAYRRARAAARLSPCQFSRPPPTGCSPPET